MRALRDAIQAGTQERTAADVLAGVKTRLEAEALVLASLFKGVTTHEEACPWNLRSNKMPWQVDQLLGRGEVLGGATLLTEENISALLRGEFFLSPEQELPAILEKEAPTPNFWGTTRGTQTQMILLFTAAEISGTKTLSQTLDVIDARAEATPIAHPVLVPEPVMEGTPGFKDSFFYYYGADGMHHLSTVHMGFIYGGYTGKDLYPAGKPIHGPWDCSSYVECVFGARENPPTSTFCHNLFSLSVLDPTAYDEKVATFEEGPRQDIEKNVARLSEMFTVIPTTEVALGDVIGWRRKSGGHVGVFAGYTSDKRGFAIMGTNHGRTKDMREGVGLEVVHHTPDTPTVGLSYYAFRPKES